MKYVFIADVLSGRAEVERDVRYHHIIAISRKETDMFALVAYEKYYRVVK